MNLRDFALGKASGGGGGEATLINKNISANGTYNASSDSADGYKKVVVAVPQPTGNINITDTSQTNVSAYATAQVVDADLVAGNIKKDVNILGITGTYEGGGGSSWTLLHEEDVAVSTTSTSATVVKTINIDGVYTPDAIICARIYDKEGVRDGRYYGSESFAVNSASANPGKGIFNRVVNFGCYGVYYQDVMQYGTGNTVTGYGVIMSAVNENDSVTISARYAAAYTKTIDSTYHVEIYKLEFPNNESPFE